MDERFIISFEYKGTQYDLDTKFVRAGYIHQFHVQFSERTLIVELDDQRQYRVIDTSASQNVIKIEDDMLEVLVDTISALH